MKTLVLYYDEYHTPLHALRSCILPDSVSTIAFHLGTIPTNFERAALSPLIDIVDARRSFCDPYLVQAIRANALYEDGYVLSSALACPCLATLCVDAAQRICAKRIVHGLCGNDGMRFMAGVYSLAPFLEVCQVSELIGSRLMATGNEHTISNNLWGASVEAGDLEEPGDKPTEDTLQKIGFRPHSKPTRLTITFNEGVSTAINGQAMPLLEIIQELNDLGIRSQCGMTDMVENGAVGGKTRALYIAPAAQLLRTAHLDLERLIYSRAQYAFKRSVDQEWARLVYDGLWYDPARITLEYYINGINTFVCGDVDMELYHGGSVRVLSRRSRMSSYVASEAIYCVGQSFGTDLLQALARRRAHVVNCNVPLTHLEHIS